jgi:hypothetical protein
MQIHFYKYFILSISMIYHVLAGNVTISIVGENPLAINIRGDTQKQEAGNKTNEGPWVKNGRTFTKRLFYDNVDIGLQDDFWTTSGVDAIICHFTTMGSGHVYAELAGSDGISDYAGIAHDVTFEYQEWVQPVGQSISDLPNQFKLNPNYPNPFNPATTIRFDIPETVKGLADTRLVIYNTTGQIVRILSQEKLHPGSYEIQWDSSTDSGNTASSGTYFVMFQAGEFIQTEKVVLIK